MSGLELVAPSMNETVTLAVEDVEFVKELYPRLREDDAAIERYRAALDKLPPIVVARGRVLVDGFHRLQAHRREDADVISAEDLGNLTDLEIRKESLRRNSSHGRQLETSDKRKQAGEMYLLGVDEDELIDLLSLTPRSLTEYLREAKKTEKERRKAELCDRWLNCEFASYREAGEAFDLDDKTAKAWIAEFYNALGNSAPESRQHFDIWNFQSSNGDSSYFGAMPPQVVENLLWFYTEPGEIVVDPFAGGGTTIDVAKEMGRRVWASDRKPSTPTLPIHEHDITTGWPKDAPAKANLILLDPPYWKQAAGKYSDDDADLGNMTIDAFTKAWATVVKNCKAHLADGGRIAYIVSPAEDKDADRVEDLALLMYDEARDLGLNVERRIIVPYQTQQATGQQVEWAREKKRMLKLYRDLVVMAL